MLRHLHLSSRRRPGPIVRPIEQRISGPRPSSGWLSKKLWRTVDDRTDPLHSRRRRGRGAPRRDDLAGRRAAGHRDPASVLAAQARLSRRRQLPRLHGRDRGRAGAGRLVRPPADARHEGADRKRARPLLAENGVRAAGRRPAGARRRARPEFALLAMGRPARRQRQPLSAARSAPRPTAAIRRWRCSSTPASSAISACAPAARSRSTT